MTLAACPSCSRHVRVDETRCPFCAHGLEGVFDTRPAPRFVVGRFSRAALFALGASAAAAGTTLACSSDDDPEKTAELEDAGTDASIYGAPADFDDAGNPVNSYSSSGPVYGAPANPRDGGTN